MIINNYGGGGGTGPSDAYTKQESDALLAQRLKQDVSNINQSGVTKINQIVELKTINGESLKGTGDLQISASSDGYYFNLTPVANGKFLIQVSKNNAVYSGCSVSVTTYGKDGRYLSMMSPTYNDSDKGYIILLNNNVYQLRVNASENSKVVLSDYYSVTDNIKTGDSLYYFTTRVDQSSTGKPLLVQVHKKDSSDNVDCTLTCLTYGQDGSQLMDGTVTKNADNSFNVAVSSGVCTVNIVAKDAAANVLCSDYYVNTRNLTTGNEDNYTFNITPGSGLLSGSVNVYLQDKNDYYGAYPDCDLFVDEYKKDGTVNGHGTITKDLTNVFTIEYNQSTYSLAIKAVSKDGSKVYGITTYVITENIESGDGDPHFKYMPTDFENGIKVSKGDYRSLEQSPIQVNHVFAFHIKSIADPNDVDFTFSSATSNAQVSLYHELSDDYYISTNAASNHNIKVDIYKDGAYVKTLSNESGESGEVLPSTEDVRDYEFYVTFYNANDVEYHNTNFSTIVVDAARIDGAYIVCEGNESRILDANSVKTINNQSIVGSGNIEIKGGGDDHFKYKPDATFTDGVGVYVESNEFELMQNAQLNFTMTDTDVKFKPKYMNYGNKLIIDGKATIEQRMGNSIGVSGFTIMPVGTKITIYTDSGDKALEIDTNTPNANYNLLDEINNCYLVVNLPEKGTPYRIDNLSSTALWTISIDTSDAYLVQSSNKLKILNEKSVKSINGQSIVGVGDIKISGSGSGYAVDAYYDKDTKKVQFYVYKDGVADGDCAVECDYNTKNGEVSSTGYANKVTYTTPVSLIYFETNNAISSDIYSISYRLHKVVGDDIILLANSIVITENIASSDEKECEADKYFKYFPDETFENGIGLYPSSYEVFNNNFEVNNHKFVLKFLESSTPVGAVGNMLDGNYNPKLEFNSTVKIDDYADGDEIKVYRNNKLIEVLNKDKQESAWLQLGDILLCSLPTSTLPLRFENAWSSTNKWAVSYVTDAFILNNGAKSKLLTEADVDMTNYYTKPEIDDKLKDIELFKYPNLTLFGTPSVNQGQISSFSASDYAQFPFMVKLDKPFEINMCFTTGNDVDTQQNIIDSNFGLALAIKNKRIVLAMSSDGTSWNLGEHTSTSCPFELEANKTVYLKLNWDGSTYNVYYEYQPIQATDTPYIYVASTQMLAPKTVIIGKDLTNTFIFNGSINLNECNLKIANDIVWQGMDDAGLSTRMAKDASNIDEAGIEKINQIVQLKSINGESIKGNGDLTIGGASAKKYSLNLVDVQEDYFIFQVFVNGEIPTDFVNYIPTVKAISTSGSTNLQTQTFGNGFKVTIEKKHYNQEIQANIYYSDDGGVTQFLYYQEYITLTPFLQEKLVSGENIKTINNTSLLSRGNLELVSQEYLDDHLNYTELHFFDEFDNETIVECLTYDANPFLKIRMQDEYGDTYQIPLTVVTNHISDPVQWTCDLPASIAEIDDRNVLMFNAHYEGKFNVTASAQGLTDTKEITLTWREMPIVFYTIKPNSLIVPTEVAATATSATVKFTGQEVTMLHGMIVGTKDTEVTETVEFSKNDGAVLEADYETGGELIDLDLPSGTLWAKCNLGAMSESDYGLYFQYAGTEGYRTIDSGNTPTRTISGTCRWMDNDVPYEFPQLGMARKKFNWSSTPYATGTDTSASSGCTGLSKYNHQTKYGTPDFRITLESMDDAVAVHGNAKSGDRMPTTAEFYELWLNTNRSQATINGVLGCKLSSKKDPSKYIFIPFAGYATAFGRGNLGTKGPVWTSSVNMSDPRIASYFEVQSGNTYIENGLTDREYGCPVRGVKSGTENRVEYVDLGLPSGKIWTKFNAGANAEQNYGLYYQYGSNKGITGTSFSTWATAPFNNGQTSYQNAFFTQYRDIFINGDLTIKPEYDAAKAYFQGDWVMPSNADIQELVANTVATNNVTISGVRGTRYANKADTSKYIFIPYGGYKNNGQNASVGAGGYFRSSLLDIADYQKAFNFGVPSGGTGSALSSARYFGLQLRAVKDGIAANQEFVDLGLPSGTLWARTNLGALAEINYGKYYQFGDTVGYDDASHSTWATSPLNGGASTFDEAYFDAHYSEFFNADGTLKPEHDAAVAAFGADSGVKMPTQADLEELIANTNRTYVNANGIVGWRLTSKVDANKYIFIRAAGAAAGTIQGTNEYANLWLSQINPLVKSEGARFFAKNPDYFQPLTLGLFYGCPIRPVKKP